MTDVQCVRELLIAHGWNEAKVALVLIAQYSSEPMQRAQQRHLTAKIKQAESTTSPQGEAATAAVVSFFVFSARWLWSQLVFRSKFGY